MRKGFTILEMMLVLSVIAIVLLITIPNVVEKKKLIHNVGCKALIEVVNSQILTYELNGEQCQGIDDLVAEGYLKPEQTKCPDGREIVIENGQAQAK